MDAINTLLQSCTLNDLSKRVEAYHPLTEILSSLPQGSHWGQEINGKLAKQITSNLKKDLFVVEQNASYEATGFLGCFLANETLMDLLTGEEEQEILDSLIKLLEETKDRSVLMRGLWSLAQSKFECETYKRNLSKLLTLIMDILKCDPTNNIIYETLQVMKSVLEAVPTEVLEKVEVWFPQIFIYLFHESLRIRVVAYDCLNFWQLYKLQEIATLHKFIIPFIPQLKSQYFKKMRQYVEESCIITLRIWRLLVLILGKYLHSGTALINGMLEVVEKAFKSLRPEFRADAFKCWYVLIGNFSTDIEVFTQPKRLKLLMAPLQSNNAKTEDIAYTKLHTWWFLIYKGENHVIEHFELLIVPLLKFCFNFNRISQSGISERTLLISAPLPQCTKYPKLLMKACEVLIRILGVREKMEISCGTPSLSDLSCPVINEGLFLKNSSLIFGCVADALMSLDYKEENHHKLGNILLEATLKLVLSILKTNPTKKDSVELVKDLFNLYDFIEMQNKQGSSVSPFLFDFLKMLIIGDLAFPQQVLHSTLYYIPVGSKVRDMMNGTLSNYFLYKLTSPAILPKAFTDASTFLTMWEMVLQKSKPANKLTFLEAVIEQLRCAIPSFQPHNADTFITLWISVAKIFSSHIKETLQITQGDNNEYDWTSVYNTFLFPMNCPEKNICSLSSSTYEKMIGTWKSLWQEFSLLTPLALTAEPNEEADFTAKKLLSIYHEKFSATTSPPSDGQQGFMLTLMTEILHIIIEKYRFREMGRKPKKMLQSPLKERKKNDPLPNLTSIIELLNLLMDRTLSLISHWRQTAMQNLCLSFTTLYTSLSQDRFIWPTVFSVIDVMKKALQINPIAKFSLDVEQKFVGMWHALCGLIECRVVPKLTQDQLATLSPLISVALQSSHLGLRQRTRLMWSTSFASTSHSISKELFEVLKGVALPPASISEMPASESQSLSPKENIPIHISGSFLNREKNQEFSPFASLQWQQQVKEKHSPSSSLSVKKTPKGKGVSPSAKVNIDDFKAEDFVMISSPKPTKRVLTPHQAEKMKERRSDIPALYNDLSQSVSQLPSQFVSADSMDDTNERTNFNQISSNVSFKGKLVSSPESSPYSSAKTTPLKEKDDLPNRSYSDEDLAEVLRNTSLAFSNSVMNVDNAIDPHEQTDPCPNHFKKIFLGCDGDSSAIMEIKGVSSDKKANSHSTKRKASLPSKKSLDDIRKSLKGTTPKRNSMSKQSDGKAARNSSLLKSSQRKDLNISFSKTSEAEAKSYPDSSPLATPLKSPSKLQKSHSSPSNSSLKNKHSPQKKPLEVPNSPNEDGNQADSEEEIPNSQLETSKMSSMILFPFTPPGKGSSSICNDSSSQTQGRPRRNKRKTIIEDDEIYVTPTKRVKVNHSPIKEKSVPLSKEDPVVISTDESHSSPLPKDSHLSHQGGDPLKSGSKVVDESHPIKGSKRQLDLEIYSKADSSDSILDSSIQKIDFMSSRTPPSPSKITRSGRRIVPPNKDMPEPMTPLGTSFKKVGSVDERDTRCTTKSTSKPLPSKTWITTRSGSRRQKEPYASETDTGSETGSVLDESTKEEEPRRLDTELKKKQMEDTKTVHSSDSESEPNSSPPSKSEPQKRMVGSIDTKEKVTKASVPVPQMRQSKRISLRQRLNNEESQKSVHPTQKVSASTLPKRPELEESSTPCLRPKNQKNLKNNVLEDKGTNPNEKVEKPHEIPLKDDINSSIIIRTMENCHTPALSSSSSAIFMTSNNQNKGGIVNTGWSNSSKYKVIFSPPIVKSPREEQNGGKDGGLPLSDGLHISSGGIVFTRGQSQKNLALDTFPKEKHLKKTKSLEKISPPKMVQSSTPLQRFRVNYKKVGNVSEPSLSTSPFSENDMLKGTVNGVDDSSTPMKTTVENKEVNSTNKEPSCSLSPQGTNLYTLTLSSPPLNQFSSSSKQTNFSLSEKIILKGSSTPSATHQLKDPQSSNKNDSLSSKLHLLINKPVTLLGEISSPPQQFVNVSDELSSAKIPLVGSRKAITSPPDSPNVLPAQTRLFISPTTQKTQKIFLLSSPKNSNSGSPIQKFIYSPPAALSSVNINSSTATDQDECKKAFSLSDKCQRSPEKQNQTHLSPIKLIWKSVEKTKGKNGNDSTTPKNEAKADMETPLEIEGETKSNKEQSVEEKESRKENTKSPIKEKALKTNIKSTSREKLVKANDEAILKENVVKPRNEFLLRERKLKASDEHVLKDEVKASDELALKENEAKASDKSILKEDGVKANDKSPLRENEKKSDEIIIIESKEEFESSGKGRKKLKKEIGKKESDRKEDKESLIKEEKKASNIVKVKENSKSTFEEKGKKLNYDKSSEENEEANNESPVKDGMENKKSIKDHKTKNRHENMVNVNESDDDSTKMDNGHEYSVLKNVEIDNDNFEEDCTTDQDKPRECETEEDEPVDKQNMSVKQPVRSKVKKKGSPNVLIENVSLSDAAQEGKVAKEFVRPLVKKGKLRRAVSSRMVLSQRGYKLSRRKIKLSSDAKKQPLDESQKKSPQSPSETEENELTNGASLASALISTTGNEGAPEKDSPNKDESRLTSSVSTPERKRLSVRPLQVRGGSRAAKMVACAKRTMQTRIGEATEGLSATISEGKCDPSSAITPSRKRPYSEGYLEGKPWAKYEPSPGASPCGSILKKRFAEDDSISTAVGGEFIDWTTESSPSSAKCRRVSFADPPVSDSVEIPPSPIVQKSYKAQKRLDMTQAIDADHRKTFLDSEISETYTISLDSPNCSQPLYPSLVSCLDPVGILASSLTSSSLAESLKVVFKERGIMTIGDLCLLSEMEVESLPIYSPKPLSVIQCLKKYEETLGDKSENLPRPEFLPADPSSTTIEAEKSTETPQLDSPTKDATGCTVKEASTLEVRVTAHHVDGDLAEESVSEDSFLVGAKEKYATDTHDLLSTPSENTKASEFSAVFCQQIEKNPDSVSSFINGLSSETRHRILNTLFDVIPYKDVVGIFHKYLLTRESKS